MAIRDLKNHPSTDDKGYGDYIVHPSTLCIYKIIRLQTINNMTIILNQTQHFPEILQLRTTYISFIS